jgi:hypothetical protein
MDEKGFLIGVLHKMRRVYSWKEMKKKRLLGASQDGNRDWITLLGAVCADGTALPPALIYGVSSGNIQDTWLKEYNPETQESYFTSSATGGANEDLGYQWLTTIFDRKTKQKACYGRDWRLLFLDGHNSHINMRFLNWCEEHCVLVAVFPPHSIHRLQPLDVTCFRSLAHHYSVNLDKWQISTQGISHLGKHEFWGIFWPAFNTSFCEKVILSGWKQTGLWLFEPNEVLN